MPHARCARALRHHRLNADCSFASMPAPDDDLRESMAAHKGGSFTEAEAGYRRSRSPAGGSESAVLPGCCVPSRRHRGAIELVRRVLGAFERARVNTLGGLYVAAGRADAREAYGRPLMAPALGEGWYNLGICLRDEGMSKVRWSATRASRIRPTTSARTRRSR
jgi:hypothetical protein